MNINAGTLYGIGTGPGDPELITIKSAKILSRVDVIFAAASTKNKHSIAVGIAKSHIPKKTPVKILSFPMTMDKEEAIKSWKNNAHTIIGELEKGKDTAFLTVGDPMTYSTYSYILQHIRSMAPHLSIVTIPGITSYQAAAASLNMPLVEGEEALLITSGVKGGDRLRKNSDKPENIVFLKAYRNVKDIVLALKDADMLEKSAGVINCSLPGEKIVENIMELNDRKPDYWSLIIAKQKKDEI